MITFGELKIGTRIEYKGEPCEIIKAEHIKIAQREPHLHCRLRNLISGKLSEVTFRSGDKFNEPDLNITSATYLYRDNKSFYFMDDSTFEQFSLTKKQLGKASFYLVENTHVAILNYKERPVNVQLPIKMDFKVIEAPPGIKGDTAKIGTKEVTIETGLKVQVPLFIKEGDIIKIDTRDSSYIKRVS